MMVSPNFKPIKQEKISTKIVAQIKSLIKEGDLKPGDALPPERELVKVFNVSRASLREALNSLAGMGFTIVKSLASGRMTEPLHLLIKDDIQTVFELIEVRKAIETWNAFHAAKRAKDDDIARHADFHLAIAEATHNKIQTHLMFSIYDLLKESLGGYYELIDMQDVYAQHCRVVEAIKNHDADLASRSMREHLDYVESRVKEFSSNDVEHL
jgi:GntR family transcriptional repressor for pyruvate dehydrogenase complex